MLEEYSLNTGELESRKIKLKSTTGKEQWVVEVGDEIPTKSEDFLIQENSNKNVSIIIISYVDSKLIHIICIYTY